MIGSTSRNAKYKQENNADGGLLENLMPKYEQSLLPDMIFECKTVIEDAERLGLTNQDGKYPQIQGLTIKNAHGEPAYYTTKLRSIIQYIPPAFSPLHLRFGFTRYCDVEYVPCYIMNANRVALAKFSLGKQQPNVHNEIGMGKLRRLVLNKGIHMRLSSTNILLQGSAQELALDLDHRIARMCFEHCWWHLPLTASDRGQLPAYNLIYHTQNRVRGIIKLHKTLLRVTRIHRSESRSLLLDTKPLECVRADVVMLVRDGETIRSEERAILISKRVATLDLESEFVSATIATCDRHPKASIVVGATRYKVGDALPILSLAMWNTTMSASGDDSLTKVGNIDEIVGTACEILEANNNGELDVFHPGFMWSVDRSGVRKLVGDNLFPLYVSDAGTVYHLPPAAIAFLLAYAPDLLCMSDPVMTMARMFDLVSPNTKKWGKAARDSLGTIPRSSRSSPFTEQLLAHVPSIAGEIAMSRIFAGMH